MVPAPRRTRHTTSRGFSLVELSIVVAIISVVAALGLEVAANYVNRSATDLSRDRMEVVDKALVAYFKVYGRLPCPAPYAYGPTHKTGAVYDYGLEDCGNSAALNTGGYGNGLYAGGVPFRLLSLPMSYASDGFSDKINYVVTKNLTVGGGSGSLFNRFASTGGTTVQNGIGGIEVRTGVLEQPCNSTRCSVLADPATATGIPGAAYLLFSNGANQRGAFSLNGIGPQACIVYSPESRPDTQNCLIGGSHTGMSVTNITNNVFYDNRYNPGLNPVSYFDDAVIWRTKAQL